jgi:hypothetical protein
VTAVQLTAGEDTITKKKVIWLPRAPEIRLARAEANMRLREISRLIGHHEVIVSRVMSGSEVSETVAGKVARTFGKRLEDLFFPVDLENPPEPGTKP